MAYHFLLAEFEDIPQLYEIIKKRVRWMDEKGLRQWNTTDYLNVYPPSYFEDHQRNGRLYKLIKDTGEIAAVMVLLDIDARWPGYEAMDSYFVHNFATDPALNGVGSMMLEEAELLSAKQGKKYLRLDCPTHNNYLNAFYESRGYIKKGRCVDGAYTGVLREKKL